MSARVPWLVLVATAGVGAGACGTTPRPAVPVTPPHVCTGTLPVATARVTGPSVAGAFVAAVTDAAPPELLVFDLDRAAIRWRAAVDADARPEIAGELVVVPVGAHLHAFELATGALRLRAPLAHDRFLGASADGEHLVYSSATLSWEPERRGSTLTMLDARTGALRFARADRAILGRPRIVGDVIYAASDQRDVVAFDLDGDPIGCARPAVTPLDWLDTAGTALICGSRSLPEQLFVCGEALPTASLLPRASLPGQPAFASGDTELVPATRSAHGRIGLVGTPELARNGRLGLAGERYTYVFYRDVFGMDASGDLRFALQLESDVVRVHATRSVIVAALASGVVVTLDAATGVVLARREIGVPLASAALSIEGIAKPSAHAPSLPAKLSDSLARIASGPDARLLPARAFAVDHLARLGDPTVTRRLLEVYEAGSAVPELRRRIAARLRERPADTVALLGALERRHDFLTDTRPPPLRAIVPALHAQRVAGAVSALVTHLFEPQTPLAELAAIASAIASLAGAAAVPPLREYLTLYHADSALADDPTSLIVAASALHESGDEAARDLVKRLAEDSATMPSLRAELEALITEPAAARPAGVATATRSPPPTLPARLDDEALDSALRAHGAALRACVLAAVTQQPELSEVRIAFIANHDGRATSVYVTPKVGALEPCIRAQLTTYALPRFERGRRLARFVIGVRERPRGAEPAADAAPFWHLSERRARRAVSPTVAPFWQSQNPLFLSVEPATPPRVEARVPEPPAADPWWIPAPAR